MAFCARRFWTFWAKKGTRLKINAEKEMAMATVRPTDRHTDIHTVETDRHTDRQTGDNT